MLRRSRGHLPTKHLKLYADDCLSVALLTFAIICLVMSQKYGKLRYGRYWAKKGKTPSIILRAKAAWTLVNLPALVMPCWMYYWLGIRMNNHTGMALMGMWLVHYTQRVFIYPCLIRGGKHVPAENFVLGFSLCLLNSFLQMMHALRYQVDQELPVVVTGVVVFAIGMIINLHSDYILRTLRKKGEDGYRIPRGGLFEYVSCANYFGEAIEWTGFAIASGFALSPFAYAAFVWCFLGPRAMQHHEWYQTKFKKYPEDRMAMIPMLL